jgi:N-glycosylase/DNA lyase
LYGLGRSEVFPTDVWIKRIVEHLYLKEEVKVEKIQEFSANKFGDLAGYAQQYLFYYGRENKIGKK